MKISKKLLKTITMALAVGAVSACEKELIDPTISKEKHEQPSPSADPCPACGMG